MSPVKRTSFKNFFSSNVSKTESSIETAPANNRAVIESSSKFIYTPGNGYKYHIFLQPGSITVVHPGPVDICCVAGGGAGGGGHDADPSTPTCTGGGGAGGMLETLNQNLLRGIYKITVGTGGRSSALGPTSSVKPGTPSVFNRPPEGGGPLVATGGGYGRQYSSPFGYSAGPGGSGGGGTHISPTADSPFIRASGIAGQGNPGSNGQKVISPPTNKWAAGGGGGGAGGAAENFGGVGPPWTGVPNQGGRDGGIGKAMFSGDTGIPDVFGSPGPTPGRWFAGGGGGGGSPNGAGGVGGGGSGGTNGKFGTGGGGGGLQFSFGPGAQNEGGRGGPGIVVIRYLI